MKRKIRNFYEGRKGTVSGDRKDTHETWGEVLLVFGSIATLIGSITWICTGGGWFSIPAVLCGLSSLETGIRLKRWQPLSEKFTYIDGLREGRYRSYWGNGNLKEKSFFRKGIKVGLSTEYYENGYPKIERTYRDGVEDGPRAEYYENGQLRKKGIWKNGKWEGPYEEYFESGQLSQKCTCKDGSIEGLNEEYYKEGQLYVRYSVRNGKMEGPYEAYFANGQLKQKCTYKDGKKEGLNEEYYENGQLRVKCFLRKGEKEGPYMDYHENGQLKQKCIYKNGAKEGLCEEYFGSGQLKIKCSYINGKYDGPYKEYDSHGKLISNRVFRNGTLLSGAEADAYLKEWKKRQLEKKPEWITLTDKLAHLTDTTYYPEIKPARTPERQTKAKKLIEIRRGAELLGKAYSEAEKNRDEEMMEEIRSIARPFATQEREQRRAFARERVLKKIRSGRK